MELSTIITVLHVLLVCLTIVNIYLSSNEPLYQNVAIGIGIIDGILGLPGLPETLCIFNYCIPFDPLTTLLSFIGQFTLLILYVTENHENHQNTDT